MAAKNRIPTDGGQSFGHNAFETLSSIGLPVAPATEGHRRGTDKPDSSGMEAQTASGGQEVNVQKKNKNRGRVDILRVKAGRGGKTVTVVKNFVGIGLPEKQQLARKMQKACGAGGTVKDGHIEIQGDKREVVAGILKEANFRPVFAGG